MRGAALGLCGGVLILILSACAGRPSDPGAASTVSIPAAWAGTLPGAAPQGTSLELWWKHFGDAVLNGLEDEALVASTSVRAAEAAVVQSRALRDLAAAGLWPSLGLSASAQRSHSGSPAAGSGNTSDGNVFRAGLEGAWDLDAFGANRNALRASQAAALASTERLGGARAAIAVEVALSYITLRAAQSRLAIARENLASQTETLQIADWRLQAGLVTSLEAEQARATTEQTRALLPALQAAIEQSAHALAVLTGRPPADLLERLSPSGPVPGVSTELALSVPAETLRRRPDVRASEFEVAAEVARVAQADAAWAPVFTISGSVGRTALTLGSLGSAGAAASAIAASVAMPLFDGGAHRAQARSQRAALEQARIAYQAAVLAALKDVEDALSALEGDHDRLRHLQAAADAASNAALFARQRFNGGLVDFQAVLDTMRTQLSTQDSVASASADLGADHVRLYQALGGGSAPPPQNGTPPDAGSGG